MNPTPNTPENPLKRVAGGVSNLLQQVSPFQPPISIGGDRWLSSYQSSISYQSLSNL
jgi:hypothetical protein